MFSGDKWTHCHGVQGVFGPDGLFVHWFDKPLGRYPDKHFMAESKVNTVLSDLQQGQLRQYVLYTDKGYNFDTHVRCASHGPGPVTVVQEQNNAIMARPRVTDEWGFGKVYERCPLVNQKKFLKLQGVDVAQIVRVAVLLTNFHTCMHQSNTGLFFHCAAPTLEQYCALY